MRTFELLLFALLLDVTAYGGFAGDAVLTARIERLYSKQLLPLVLRQEELFSEAEKLRTWMQQPGSFVFDLVNPEKIKDATHFEHKVPGADGARGKAKVSEDGKHLLDFRGVPCEARVVFDTVLGHWLIQFSEAVWRLYVPDEEEVPEPIVKVFFHEVIRLAWHEGIISSNDNGSMISAKLKVPPARPRDEKLPAFLKEAGSIVDARFIGDMRCGEALFGPDPEKKDPRNEFSLFGDFPGEKIDKRLCHVELYFGKEGNARYEVKPISSGTVIFSTDKVKYQDTNPLVPGAEGNRVKLAYLGEEKTLFVFSHRDVLKFSEGALYRVDPKAPSVAGKTFRGEMFCNAVGLSGPGGDVRWSIVLPVGAWRLRFLCDVTVTFGFDDSFEYRWTGDDDGDKTYRGTYKRIGHNIVLHTNELYAAKGYLWISRGRGGRELVTQVGEYLFENFEIRQEVFPPLAGKYVENPRPRVLPGVARETFRDGTITELEFNKPKDALVTVKIRSKVGAKDDEEMADAELPENKDESWEIKKHIGFYLRGGTTVGVWVQGVHSRLYRVTNGALLDGLASELIPAP